jgi:hypothetical protein
MPESAAPRRQHDDPHWESVINDEPGTCHPNMRKFSSCQYACSKVGRCALSFACRKDLSDAVDQEGVGLLEDEKTLLEEEYGLYWELYR